MSTLALSSLARIMGARQLTPAAHPVMRTVRAPAWSARLGTAAQSTASVTELKCTSHGMPLSGAANEDWVRRLPQGLSSLPRAPRELLPAHDLRAPSSITVAVGMSGGVDSATTAFLLQAQGFNVLGVYMTNWEETEETGQCSGAHDLLDAQAVCNQLSIPFFHLNFVKEYWNEVFDPALARFGVGLTPNPDVACNRHIKFGALTDAVLSSGSRPHPQLAGHSVDYLSTGHYASTRWPGGPGQPAQLERGVDPRKDQTYFLANVRSGALDRVLLPLGVLHKRDIRMIAKHAGLRVAEKRESMGICFIGKRKFTDFILDYADHTPGTIVDWDTGAALGTHAGLCTRTIGQKARLPGMVNKWYVVDKDVVRNELLVVEGRGHAALMSTVFFVRQFSWLSGNPPPELEQGQSWRGIAVYTYGSRHIPCSISAMTRDAAEEALNKHSPSSRQEQKRVPPGGADSDLPETLYCVSLDSPAYAVTAGQTLAVYDSADRVCLGSAVIVARQIDASPKGRANPIA